jgi:O-antigen/teichoic acid export membrane protein
VTIDQLAAPMRWVPDILQRARSDSLVRNSLFIMTSTVVTAGFGYVFWVIAAHVFTRQEVGIGGAVVSLCSTVALLTYLGPQALLI